MSHLEFHPHAFINENNIVINVAVFDGESHNTQLINDACTANGGVEAICCCVFGMTSVGETWTGSKFIPISPYPSWIWDDVNNKWKAPVNKPNDDIYVWNEDITSWVLFVPSDVIQ
jgi:hypothetical protein